MTEIIRGMGQMAKGLTIAAMAIAALLMVLFGLDLATGIPFGGKHMMMDIAFVIGGLGIGFLCVTTWRELA